MSGTIDLDECYVRGLRGVVPTVLWWRERVLQPLDKEHGCGLE
jgi:hypothetical protein